ncbi:uncharacterized protein LOC132166778 [Corylus avellana]|uniref:uncharacterized protein LOC132166778 n=1 Tax=Corylus avellana TaxID=13451 RepID=UPI00286C969A|nr:uncharacterized protein LOC132166778 [Corylus avellana]
MLPAARIARKSSIESEPRTLGIHQIQYAREAAEYVVNTRSIEEAISIFTKGLKPVVGVARDNGNTKMDRGEEQECAGLRGHLRLQEPRDIASAPF